MPVNQARVVCLGGSAGALQSYLDILRSLPPDTGMVFVVVAHRGPKYPELLPRLLSNSTRMPVVEVEEGMALEPNHVFLGPADKSITSDGRVFHVHDPMKPHGWHWSIDLFLRSLARTIGDKTTAVILSGMDTDGSGALKEVKAAGGVVFVQSNPAYHEMPRHAIGTGQVDFVMRPTEIAEALLRLNRGELESRDSADYSER